MPFSNRNAVEDPRRIDDFLNTISTIDWKTGNSDGWDKVFEQCTHLIKSEIDYYYTARKKKRLISFWTRLIAFFFGTCGFLAPLIETAGHKGIAPYGFMLLAISAAFFTANRLYGGTSGHTRFVVAQLNLERILTLMVIEWEQLCCASDDNPNKSSAHDLKADFLKNKMSEVYSVLLEETESWGKSISQAMSSYEARVVQNENEYSSLN